MATRAAIWAKAYCTAVNNINTTIKTCMVGQDVAQQRLLDQMMIDADGTENKAHFGANAILAVISGSSQSSAQDQGIPLYAHIANINGTPVSTACRCR